MCLENAGKRKIAKKDIVCYKTLYINVECEDTVKDGDTFTGVIANRKCKGKISIQNSIIFFCTNNFLLDGVDCEDKKGFSFSWKIDNDVSSIIVNNRKVICINEYVTPYRHYKIKIGETYSSKLDRRNKNREIRVGLHSFKYLEDIKRTHNIIAECIIPKGSKYYEGLFGGSMSFASDTLKYVRIID